jgi:hypothetical protein
VWRLHAVSEWEGASRILAAAVQLFAYHIARDPSPRDGRRPFGGFIPRFLLKCNAKHGAKQTFNMTVRYSVQINEARSICGVHIQSRTLKLEN